jgi:hypothetical protein
METFKERRNATRYDCMMKVDYSSNGVASVYGSTVSDNVSKLGICIPVSRLVRKGSTLELVIHHSPTSSPIHAVGRVRWTKPTPEEPLYMVNAGIMFSEIDDASVEKLISSCS